MTARVWTRRAGLLGLGVAAVVAGVVVGSSGCGRCRCPDLDPVQLGPYDIVGSEARPELVGGMVELSSEHVEVSFTDLDGNAWVIDYSH